MTIMFTTPSRANLRRTPQFGNNIRASLDFNTPVDVTGPQQGDRWLPVRVTLDGATEDHFISVNTLRAAQSDAKEALIAGCAAEWIRFERGTRQEFEDPWFARVGDYWASIGIDLDGRDRDVPWSAAFISFVVRQAGPDYAGFVFAAAHARYTNAAIVAREDGTDHPFWGFRLNEHRPVLGDMVCRWRVTPITYDFARDNDAFKSHCDIVCRIEDDAVFTIGGNVRHSARHTRYAIDGDGFLTGAGNVYAVLRNNR